MLRRSGPYHRVKSRTPSTIQRHPFRSAEDFAHILEIERRRADRSNTAFSLLAFACQTDESLEAVYTCLSAILQRRLRVTDSAGWLDARRVGVVLPDTLPSGAWILGQDICRQFPEHVPAPVCTVMGYPSEGLSGDSQKTDGANGNGRHHSERPSSKGHNGFLSPRPGHREEDKGGDSKPVESIEMLFVAPASRWTRLIDVMAACVGLVLLSPLFVMTALAIKCTSRGPVFFAQDRTGQGGRRFRMYKFRSMVVNAESLKPSLSALNEQDGPAFKLKNDPRVTKIGHFLRTTCIDELPQLWNVLRGEMSLVGPRPLPCEETDRCERWQRQRLEVAPGLTCTWQVFGGTHVSFAEWMRMDLRYAASRHFWIDMWLVAVTIPAILCRRRVHCRPGAREESSDGFSGPRKD
jgi:lipopolysaccharide/colanic/teichoic acid biosynthesis glycosyltransferase